MQQVADVGWTSTLPAPGVHPPPRARGLLHTVRWQSNNKMQPDPALSHPRCLLHPANMCPRPTVPWLSRRARLWVPAQRLEAARKCFGTDEDLLLVEVPGGSACCSSAGSSSSEGGAAADAATDAAGGTAQAGAAGGGRQGPPEAPPVLQQQQQQQPEDWGAAGASPRIVYG